MKNNFLHNNINSRIPLEVIINGNSKVLSGRAEGKIMRDKLKLDTRDSDDKKYIIKIPNIFAITASYFLECFGKSIRKLGKEKFNDKYKFNVKNQSVEDNIISGIDSALIIKMPF